VSAPVRHAAGIDPEYEIDSDIPPRELWEKDRDSVYYFDTVVRRVLETVMEGASGRLLDVGSGDGHQLLAFLRAGGVAVHGIDTSDVLLRRARAAFAAEPVRPGLVAASAERLPFADGAFERIVCQGSLDHFGAPEAFIAEAARCLAVGGRLVIALQNFDSASCWISRAMYGLRGLLRMSRVDPTGGARPYWRIPDNHTFRGNAAVLRRMTRQPGLERERMFGVSMFWLLPMWRRLIRRAPAGVAGVMLRGVDGVARRAPGVADMIVGVWVKVA
jgi:SAM-dependent methyltransferase